ncbi:hypothetical protein G6F57_001190 [Rhizopus arrhizus]|uniref:AAA+ ATPase domain-containing protein n=1 Tax=Rhizopus oryzae TaxID=64495 RepID=A0A9P7BSQ5_RHIOR|nr:hypothetical protein G6F23_001382 [Rhizopus arrhizus]KAG1426315.1 hypothetical protein G6F58_001546 [Rhizopus delemar]KAG0764012.1 hypothetical protein G6F24_005557 [Rhizopus arrhizus]KAG0790751.1 hypothetical protein G6F21_005576 [Rhizopus arrhizus]KAG0801956.1 hypothetical protein G6F22_000739 [Rhizopus arrhizus]
MGPFLDSLLCLLETISDEIFWHNLLGERALNLLKRYFGSDVVFLGFIVYLAPIVGYQFNTLLYWMYNKVAERMYVSIQISQKETGYDEILQFVASKTSQIRDLRNVEGRCEVQDENDWQTVNPPPKLNLYPLDEIEHRIVYKGNTFWITKKKNGDTNKEPNNFYSNDLKELLGAMSSNPCIQITMRGQDLKLLQSIIQGWIDTAFKKVNGKLTIYKCLPTRYEGFEWVSVGYKELRSFESVVLKEGQKERLLMDIQRFRGRETWYTNRGIPYRRGYLLYGPPGTGKTSLVQSVASKVKMNVAIISLSGAMDDEKFSVLLQEIPRNSILIMEDIDHCVIKDPSNDSTTSKITMSGLLNALDGVAAQEGSMIFMTCNDLSRIQPALLRPGRIDMKMELGYADKEQIRNMFWRFLSDDEDEEPAKHSKELEALADRFTDLIPDLTVTPAELQNFFIMNVMDKEQGGDFEYLLDAIPLFLESVQKDRQQAIEHKVQKNNSGHDVD